jgi:23S rRNA (cytidine1920-2'-O)/16S rRNA (cytidine1409-2'-O)-methyltransferase
MERVNARTITADTMPETIGLVTVDVSFISLSKVLGPITTALGPSGRIIALVKPQFEVGRGRTNHGVVREPALHREVLERVVEHAQGVGLGTRDVIASPILGPEGNREFLVHLTPGPGCADIGARITEVAGA